jgi:antitoxin (DNA-binding transcriptional repressor) of toxin-antitoxin stability system
MKTITASELGRRPEHVLRELQTEKEMVVTRYGKPIGIMVPVTEENLEVALAWARLRRAKRAVR